MKFVRVWTERHTDEVDAESYEAAVASWHDLPRDPGVQLLEVAEVVEDERPED